MTHMSQHVPLVTRQSRLTKSFDRFLAKSAHFHGTSSVPCGSGSSFILHRNFTTCTCSYGTRAIHAPSPSCTEALSTQSWPDSAASAGVRVSRGSGFRAERRSKSLSQGGTRHAGGQPLAAYGARSMTSLCGWVSTSPCYWKELGATSARLDL